MDKLKKKNGWYGATILWTIIIFVLSILPGSTIKKFWTIDFFSMDKVAHMTVYFILSIGLWKSFDFRGFIHKNRWTIMTAGSYGVLMEVIQFLFFPYRYFDLFDIIANIIGSTLGVVVIHFLTHKKQ